MSAILLFTPYILGIQHRGWPHLLLKAADAIFGSIQPKMSSPISFCFSLGWTAIRLASRV